MAASTSRGGHSANVAIACALLVAYLAINVVLNVFNKWLFTGPLRVPIFVTMTHQIGLFLGAALTMAALPGFYTRTPIKDRAMLLMVLIIPFGFVISIGLNNLSLKYCALSLNLLIRSMAPVTVAVAAFFIEGKRYSGAKIATIAVLVGGVVLGVGASTDFEIVGFSLCVASVVGQTLQIVLTGYFVGGQEITLQVFDVLLYTAIPSIVILAPLSYALGELKGLEAALVSNGPRSVLLLVAAGCALAFAYNVVSICLIKYTSSVYFAVAGGFKMCVTIAVSYLVFQQSKAMLSLVGVAIACAAFLGHSYVNFVERRAPSEKIGVGHDGTGGKDRSFGGDLSDVEESSARVALLGDARRGSD